jgi:predicted peptidase
MQMITRREAVCVLSSASALAFLNTVRGSAAKFLSSVSAAEPATSRSAAKDDAVPALAPGAPMSAQREALIEAFKEKSVGIPEKFEARTFKGDGDMPYRLFKPEAGAGAGGKLPLVIYLHGSGGLGDDNEKQMGLGNIFGTRVFALPENQKRFPCYVLAPQTDRGWASYDFSQRPARPLAQLGDGSKMALRVIDALRREFPIDDRRIYVTGQSMGGVGVWNLTAYRQKFFAAAIPCCGSAGADDVTLSADTPVWAFQGDADDTVPVATSRERIAALRKAGAHPLYTEYAGVGHNVWEWAYTEPALIEWIFAQRR